MSEPKVSAIPNILTTARLIAGLVMFCAFWQAWPAAWPFVSTLLTPEDIDAMMRWAVYAFIFGALTDLFDGLLARHLHAETRWGAILDPIADKILVCGTILGLINLQPQSWLSLPFALILFREFAVSALREAAAAKGVSVHVSYMRQMENRRSAFGIGLATLGPSLVCL